MPAAPKEDGLSRRVRQPVTSNNGPTFPTTFLPAQSERLTAEVGPVENDVTPVEYRGSDLVQYRAPFLASNQQSYAVQGSGSLDAPIFTSDPIAAEFGAPDPSLASFHSRSSNHSGFYFNAVGASQQQDECLSDVTQTHLDKEDYTTSISFSKHLKVTQGSLRPNSTGLQPSIALSPSDKGPPRLAPALLRASLKTNPGSRPSSAVLDPTRPLTGWARQPEDTGFNDWMSNPTPVPGTSGHRSADTGTKDQLASTTTDSISDTTSGSRDDVEANGSGGGRVSVAAQQVEPNIGANQPPRILQTARTQHTEHTRSGLPPEKVFPIQIGSELFRLSGASVASDGQYSTC